MDKMLNIIVFGGGGFVGSHVADVLSEKGHNVNIYDIRPSKYLRPSQKMIIGDILDEKTVRESVKGMDVVYNFAGIADIGEAANKPVETVKYNILGNTIVLDAAKEADVKRFVYASTIYVYSESGSFYRCSKNACELYLETYQKEYGLDYTVLRYGTLYGSRSNSTNSVYRFIHQSLTEEKISYPGDGNEIREYINVLDAAHGSVEILDDEYRNEYVTFTGHHPMRVSEFFVMIKEILKKDIKVEYIQPTSDEHYKMTPYTFIPKMGKKYVRQCYTDLGQGILLCMQEIYDQIHSHNEQRLQDKS